MNFTAPGLAASVQPESFYLIGWLGLALPVWLETFDDFKYIQNT